MDWSKLKTDLENRAPGLMDATGRYAVLVPLVGWIVLLVFLCTDSGPDNQWGPNPKGYGGGYGSSYGGYGPAQQPYQNQGYQNQGYQNQDYQNQGYQDQSYQAPGPSDPPDHDRYKGPEL